MRGLVGAYITQWWQLPTGSCSNYDQCQWAGGEMDGSNKDHTLHWDTTVGGPVAHLQQMIIFVGNMTMRVTLQYPALSLTKPLCFSQSNTNAPKLSTTISLKHHQTFHFRSRLWNVKVVSWYVQHCKVKLKFRYYNHKLLIKSVLCSGYRETWGSRLHTGESSLWESCYGFVENVIRKYCFKLLEVTPALFYRKTPSGVPLRRG